MDTNISLTRLEEVLAKMGTTTIIVIGDAMIDEYFWGDVQRISPEAPVPVVAVESVSRRLGGAANVAQNLATLGVQPMLHHLPDGTPLYCPFPISATIPAMMIPHLTVGGAAEAVITGGVIAFLGRYHGELFGPSRRSPGTDNGPGGGS